MKPPPIVPAAGPAGPAGAPGPAARAPAGAPAGPVEPRLEHAREVVRLEARTIAGLEARIGESFLRAVELCLGCQGLVIVTGMGKAGLVGAKIASTLASTGTPSASLHPAEALHGDLGRIRGVDVVLALSNSGVTEELLALVPRAARAGAKVIVMTGAPGSPLARLADHVLDIGRVDEACPLGLAPTASTSAMLVLGDALAMVVLRERGFSREDYARYHPAGALGRRLMRAEEVMRKGHELPLVPSGTFVSDVIITMSRTPGRPGAALVVDGERRLIGIFTDGDLRRLLETVGAERLSDPVDEHMGRRPKTVAPDALVEEAENLLREHRIDQIAVVDSQGLAVGLVDVQDLLHTRL